MPLETFKKYPPRQPISESQKQQTAKSVKKEVAYDIWDFIKKMIRYHNIFWLIMVFPIMIIVDFSTSGPALGSFSFSNAWIGGGIEPMGGTAGVNARFVANIWAFSPIVGYTIYYLCKGIKIVFYFFIHSLNKSSR